MNQAELLLVLKAKDLASKEVKGLQKSLGGVSGGLGAIGVSALGMGAAIAGVFAQSIKMAIDEEKNIARLGASLKANIPAWDGNTAAIEKQIRVRENMAFSDDDLRDSLAKLVGSTKDVSKAFALQRTAMDLARYANIDLTTASDVLMKVQIGQFKALKGLGIKVKDFATTEEALAAIQKTVTGQAEAYAETVGGKMLTAQIKIDDAMEDFGSISLPAVADAADEVSGALTNVSAVMAVLQGDTSRLSDVNIDLVGVFERGLGPIGFFKDGIEDAGDSVVRFITGAKEVIPVTYDVATAFTEARENAAPLADAIRIVGTDAQKTRVRLKDLKTAAQSALGPVLEAVYGPAILKGQEAGLLGQIRDTKAELKEAKKAGDKLEITKLQGQLAEQQSDLVVTREKMSALGDKPAKDSISNWLKAVDQKVIDLKNDTHAALTTFQVLGGYTGGTGGGGGGRSGQTTARAVGGPTNPNRAYWVGENGPELWQDNHAGTITPANRLPSGSNGGKPTPIIVQVDGRELFRIMDAYGYSELQRSAATLVRS